MLQKTYLIETVDEAKTIVAELKDDPIVSSAKQGILQVFSFVFTYEETEDIIRPIRNAFPDLIVSGMSVYFEKPPKPSTDELAFDETPSVRLSFMFLEEAKVIPLTYDLKENDHKDVVEKIREKIKNSADLKAVGIFVAGYFCHVSDLLDSITEGFKIPFFGTMADVYYISERRSEPYLFDGEKSYDLGITILLYTGKDLFVEEQYIFGWKPIGKAMEITPTPYPYDIGDSVISAMDDIPPEKIYHKYLGIDFDEYLTANCCEFPLVIERDGLMIGRTPFGCNDRKELIFMGSIRPEENVRFSYAVRDELIANTEKNSHTMLQFRPQAIQLYVCGNRAMLLRDESMLELECFSRIVKDTMYCGAAGEIYYNEGIGGFLNSALIAIGFREGPPRDFNLGEASCQLVLPKRKGVRPLSQRISKFMQGMSGDLVEYANEATRANEAKSAFLANMSHEIRTPINAVLGMDEMILRESREPETLSYAEDIQSAGRTLLSIINDILDFSKVEEGKMEILPTQYDLSSVINDLYNMMRPRMEKKGLSFAVSVDENIPHLLYGDEIRIRQCALNVLTNAVKYTEKGSVTFSVDFEKLSEDKISLIFTIKDTGIGMKKEDLERLYSPFERIEEERNRAIEGTGLGMTITKQLLSLMDSTLEVESVYGEGSKFTFAIEQPVVKWEPIGSFDGRYENAISRDSYEELFHAPEARILVVDDTEMNITVMQGLLKRTGIIIDTALSGHEALVLSEKNKYDVLFIDHMMPDMDGIETLNRIRETGLNIETPSVALTANAVSGAREMYLDAGFNDYLSKPVEGAKLERMLLNLLPEKKIVTDEVAYSTPQSANDGTSLPAQLSKIPNLNTADGLKNCGGPEGYFSVLQVFHQTAIPKAEEIRKLWNENDFVNYTVKVHALKSSARIIGAAELSELAKKLEVAGKRLQEENTNEKTSDDSPLDFINDNTEKLLSMYLSLNDSLSVLDKKNDALPDITPKALKEAYQTIAEIASAMDYGLMDEVLEHLSGFNLPPEDAERIAKIQARLMELDFEGISEILP